MVAAVPGTYRIACRCCMSPKKLTIIQELFAQYLLTLTHALRNSDARVLWALPSCATPLLPLRHTLSTHTQCHCEPFSSLSP